MTLNSLADVVRSELAGPRPDQNFLLRMAAQAISDYRSLHTPADQDRFLRRPDSTGERRWDAMLAAIAEREARRSRREIPEWVYDNVYVLSPWWFLSPTESLRAYSLQHSAPEFAIRNIFIDVASLESV
ncbi:hypothetical protein [Myceligenerans pegani]|uniref:Uncharacterized protein n=1 Tax=Myceligenerans pegani TaxID=2776917 RepID=A0ABR9MZ80_9MICO|nr:hypothetical protein [Myceligenerans sp. TRM 65318]MBE1876705.1 hypothetical protein [Myceligenerans sp. TRM 65318]MBE3018976.1 hypothetical protein [Myceligenerans sp. TRM 65318]